MTTRKSFGIIVFVLASVFLQLAAVQDASLPGVSSSSSEEKRRPLNLKVVEFSYKTISITWDPPLIENLTEVISYSIYYHYAILSSDSAWTSERQVAGNVTQFLIKGVQPGTNYAIFVAANFSHEPEARSIVITHQTKGYGMSKVCPCSAPGTDMSQNMDAICNYKTGVCFCKNKFFKGDRCDQCHVKYYWVNDNLGCQPCGCPEDNVRTTGACYPDGNDSVRCHCLSPYTGIKCDLCERGHFRDSKGLCHKCQCNGNENAAAKVACDSKGRCLDCAYNTAGDKCEVCAEGFTGSALQRNCTPIHAHEDKNVMEYDTGSNMNLAMGISVPLLVLTVIIVCSIVVCKQVRDRKKPLKLWTVSLNDEGVNFSSQMEDGHVATQLLKDDVRPYTDLSDPIS